MAKVTMGTLVTKVVINVPMSSNKSVCYFFHDITKLTVAFRNFFASAPKTRDKTDSKNRGT
jgi:hypothetical protein